MDRWSTRPGIVTWYQVPGGRLIPVRLMPGTGRRSPLVELVEGTSPAHIVFSRFMPSYSMCRLGISGSHLKASSIEWGARAVSSHNNSPWAVLNHTFPCRYQDIHFCEAQPNSRCRPAPNFSGMRRTDALRIWSLLSLRIIQLSIAENARVVSCRKLKLSVQVLLTQTLFCAAAGNAFRMNCRVHIMQIHSGG